MSEAIRDGLLAVIRTLPEFDGANSSGGDPSVLKAGVKYACIVSMAEGASEPSGSGNNWSNVWGASVDILFRRRKGELSEYDEASWPLVAQVIQRIQSYPTLNGVANVVRATPLSWGPLEIGVGEMRNWARVSIDVEIRENVVVSLGE